MTEKQYESYEVPPEELPKGVSYRKIYGKKQPKTFNEYAELKLVPKIDPQPGKWT